MEEKIVGIRFKGNGKPYYFSTDMDLALQDKVVVETVRGFELGSVATSLKEMSEFDLDTELKKVLRKATETDLKRYEDNLVKGSRIINEVKEIVKRMGLEARVVSCEYTLDSTKLIVMYISEDKIDFRELLKELTSKYQCRIELRQIGPRDTARIVSGYGICGMPLCCTSFVSKFDGLNVAIAKNQMLMINMEKLSGICGKFKCCLRFEDEMYTELKKQYPKVDSKVEYNGDVYKLTHINLMNGILKLEQRGAVVFTTLDQIKPISKTDGQQSH